ncbi:hypothetical protein KUV85_14360 [Nocardioides panacisoli]|uniref:hypothetical protein n=1 Tax=Nocardioides panacisoli TaxID=627624 RepID=UPI001C62CE29|nr:hypothetical protein [Nocardioides panacisoli]QYJ03501.1 hypothetical protein KUV85_14360 [Nocardioides panacisoli]
MFSAVDRSKARRAAAVTLWLLVTAAAAAAMVAAMVPVGPDWLGAAGSVGVATTFTWGLASRTGGRPIVFGALACAMAASAAWVGPDQLRTGGAVLIAAVSAVFAVMVTVPTKGFLGAVRECVIALVISAIGALAVVGLEPTIRVARFEYGAAGLALVGIFILVSRLGAGLHGLGRRGLIIVIVGAAVLAVGLLYAELLRTYSTTMVVDTLLSWVSWSREELGAFPRPMAAALGFPALAYGVHMRARRRQGWWVCAFGVAGTVSVATVLANPSTALQEAGLSVVYGLVVGLVIGFLLIRLDLALTGSRGKRSREAERDAAVRPEPARTAPLL